MKIGLVLAGGGARGAYQIGVWKALRKLDIDKYINSISGTSIGGLNAMLFSQGNLELAEEVWLNIDIEKIFPTDHKDLLAKSLLLAIGSKNLNLIKKYIPKAINGGDIARDGLIEIVDKYLDFDKIRNNNKTCYAACSEIPKLEPKYFKINNYSNEDIKKILLATSALPMIYESEHIEGKNYLDGGMTDNVPIQPVYGEDCDIIIVVPLELNFKVNRALYPNSKIIEITPSEMEEGFIDGALDFTKDNSIRRIKLGYEDTINQLRPIMDIALMIEENNKNKEIEKRKKKMFFNIIKEKLFGEKSKENNNRQA